MYTFEREYDDDGNLQLIATPDTDEKIMIIITKTDQGYYGLADLGLSDVVGPCCKTALQAYFTVLQCNAESEAWAAQMLQDHKDGKIEYYHNEPKTHPDGTVEMTGGWRKANTH